MTQTCAAYTNHTHQNAIRTAATNSTGCSTYANLCGPSDTCGIALLTAKYKKAKNETKVDCCSADFGGFCRTDGGWLFFASRAGGLAVRNRAAGCPASAQQATPRTPE
jgi:hypothetical protein